MDGKEVSQGVVRKPCRLDSPSMKRSKSGTNTATPVVEDYADKTPNAFFRHPKKVVVVLEPQKLSDEKETALRGRSKG